MKHYRRTLYGVFLSLILMGLFSLPAKGTTAVMLTDTELIVNSRIIVSGRVIAINSAWDDQASMVWTYVELLTDRVLKGEISESTIVLKQLGGSVGESGIRVAGQPEFGVGERVLLYLNTGTDGSLHSAHNFMGKFSIKHDSAGREFVERNYGANDIDILARTGDAEVTNTSPLNAYIDRIQDTLRRKAALVQQLDYEKRSQPIVAIPAEYAGTRNRDRSGGFTPEFVLFSGGVRWMEADSGQAINYYVNGESSPVTGGGTAEIARAMDAWPGQSGAGIRLQIAGQTGSCGIRTDNTNTISFGDCMNQLDAPVGCSGIVALTSISYTREPKVIAGVTFNRLLEADIIFNKGMACFLANSANLAEVACHELGHSIGLDHPLDTSAIMYAVSHGRGRDATLGADDKTGVLAIYPASGGGGTGGPPASGQFSITTLGITDGVVGRNFAAALTASGGTPPYRWSLVGGVLPPGLSFSSNGVIDGVPTRAVANSFAVQVIDSSFPPRVDGRWYAITIRDGDGTGLPGIPAVTSVKVKGVKKLWVTGANFRTDSLVIVNGVTFQPVSFVQEGSQTQLLAKGKLNLGPTGTNTVFVLNASDRSAPYVF